MWEQIRSNQRRSVILLVLMATLLLLLGFVLGEAYQPGGGGGGLGVAFLVWLILALVSYYQGGNIMLALSGAKEIQRNDIPMLYNIVEEMKIASGMPRMPRIFIIDDTAPNAFATGRDPEHAAVAVTAGLLKTLNRNELQGVIAHEIAHIQNRDVLLMIMVGVMLGSIVHLANIGFRVMFYGGGRRSRSSSGGGQAQAIMIVISLVLAILAPIVAYLIYFAISRRREYLADAGGAQYTRYPEGLASALEKISMSSLQLARASKATSPMYIINPLKPRALKAGSLTSTHPPVSERIKILRSMAGGASYADYEKAFRKVQGGKAGIIPARTLETAPTVPLESPASPAASLLGKSEKVRTQRQTRDALWKANKYRMIDCDCSARLKVPPTHKTPRVKCPRCGKEHKV